MIKLSDVNGNILPIKNPETNSNLVMFVVLFIVELLIFLAVILYFVKKKKLTLENIKGMKKTNLISIFIFLGLVMITIIGYSYALEVTEIKVTSKIKILKARLARNCS